MEFPGLGGRCSYEDCGRLDFLPVACSHCQVKFCKDHLSPFVHNCQHFKDNVLTDADLAEKEKERWQVKCTLPQCHVKDLLPMACPKCGNHFCLSHRHADQHECEVMKKDEAEKLKAAKKAIEANQSGKDLQMKVKQDIINRLEEAKAAGGSKGAMATKLALMKLKGRAKGDSGVPQSDRIFFSVDCYNKEQNPKPLDVWMSKSWSLGKAVDFMARQARIKNKNNVSGAPKLHFFKDDLCLTKTFDRTITEILTDGLVVDGDALSFKLVKEIS